MHPVSSSPPRRLIGSLFAVLLVLVLVGSFVVLWSRIHQDNSSSTTLSQSSAGLYAAYNTSLYKFDARTGTVSWQYQAADKQQVFGTSPVVANNAVYISTGNTLYALKMSFTRKMAKNTKAPSGFKPKTPIFCLLAALRATHPPRLWRA